MGKRLDLERSANLALLYTYDASNGIRMLLSYDRIKEFDLILDINLDEMNSPVDYHLCNEESDRIYFYSKDKCGKEYLILRPDIDLGKARRESVGYLPLDVIIASQQENALKKIGIGLQNGHFIDRTNICNKVKRLSL